MTEAIDPAPDSVAAFSETVEAIYDAALDHGAWPAALARIGALFDAEGAVIIFYDRSSAAEFIHSAGLKRAVDTYLDGEWWRQDLHAHRAIELHLSVGDVLRDQTIATPAEIDTHPIYTQFFASVGFGWLMTCVLLPDHAGFVGLSVPRAKAKGAFTERETELLGRLGGHVEHALRLSLRIGELETSERALGAALDALDAGVIALTGDRGVAAKNRIGAAQLEDHLAEVDGRVVARRQEEAPRFDALIQAVRARRGVDPAPRACTLTGQAGDRVAAWAMPLTEASRRRLGAGEPALVLLLTTQLEREGRVDAAAIRDLLGLSSGEARLAALIGAGMAVNEAAERLGIAEGTARVVLKKIFRKLGINRQAELALRIAALGPVGVRKAPPLRDGA